MTTVTFVNDPDLSRVLGERLAQEVQDAVQPTGDCAACGNTLGTGPLRIDVRGDEFLHLAHPRHASCQPAPDGEMLVMTRENTYLVNAAATTLHTTAPKRRRFPFFRRTEAPKEVSVPEVFLLGTLPKARDLPGDPRGLLGLLAYS